MNIENKKTALDDDAAIYQRIEETESAKSERQKFSEMDLKGKYRYFMDYYALKVLIGFLIALLVGYIVYVAVRPKPDTVAQIVVVDSPWAKYTLDSYRETLEKDLGLTPEKEEILLNSSYQSANSSDITAISTFLFANTLDIIISTRPEALRYAENAVFLPLEEKLPADLLAVIPEEDYLQCERTDEESDGKTHVYAIRVNNTAFGKYVTPEGYNPPEMYLGIHPCSDERVELSFNILRVMYGLPIPE